MLKIPPNDIMIIGLLISLIGGFILAKNYLPLNMEKVELEGRMQFGGNSFDMKSKIITKYNAWVGLIFFTLGILISITCVFLQKYITYADLRGRSLLFNSIFNTITTIAVFLIVLRVAVFLTEKLPKCEYVPYLKEREKDNFDRAIKNLNEKSDNENVVKDEQREIDQLLILFDLKVRENLTYDDKISVLKREVFSNGEQ